MAAVRSNPEIRLLALQLAESKRKPHRIRKAQQRAWARVIRMQTRLQKLAKALDQEIASARTVMLETAIWEKQDRRLRDKFIQRCERVRHRASSAELETVKKIRQRLGDKLQRQAKRVPALRRAMSPQPSS